MGVRFALWRVGAAMQMIDSNGLHYDGLIPVRFEDPALNKN
jgi:hypothetical protein